MKRLLQIDTCLGVGSTGRITENIAQLAQNQGWECFIVHGARYVKKPSRMNDMQSVSVLGEYLHYAQGLMLDNHGLASTQATKRVVDWIKEVKPHVIHLHCIHGYYLNYRILFDYLNTTNIPIVWTFHDCWAFTGHCGYFDKAGCEAWKTGCKAPCPCKADYPKSVLLDRSERNFNLKKKLFTSLHDRLTIVPVSYWLEGFVRVSFFKNTHVQTIHNGIDLEVFSPKSTDALRKKLDLGNRKVVLGVALPWCARKGLDDMLHLAGMLPKEEYAMILIGLDDNQMRTLPENIVGMKRTNNADELAECYSLANVFVNPTYEDNFPTTNLEALACGTPVVTYRTGGSPEAIDEKTGIVVEQGDKEAIAQAVIAICNEGQDTYAKLCRQRAEQYYDKDKCFLKYLEMYNRLIG